MIIIKSLALRLFMSASVWIIFTLFCGGLLLSNVFRDSSEKAFEDKLNLFMETLIGASKVDSTSSITVVNSIGDPRFFQPYSGWYWQINEGSKTLVRSRSMWDQVLTIDKRLIGGRAQFINSAIKKDRVSRPSSVRSKSLMIIQREISFPGIDKPLTFMISGDTNEYEQNILRYNNILISSLVILGLGLLLSVFLQVKYGLLPLGKIKNSLFKIRNGDAMRLEGNYPTEVSPLATEINILIDNNEKIVERAKTHVGNLAHALKTPLAVISNELNSIKGQKIAKEQLNVIENHVDKYLKKARISALKSIKKNKVNTNYIAEKMVKVFKKIHPNINFKLIKSKQDLMFVGREDDLEEIFGNLMDNGCKWALDLLKITIKKESKGEIKFIFEDNGKGLPKKKMSEVFARGFRLDEQTPGTGLGLNIVKDTIENNNGNVWLEKSDLGGLRVNIILPLSMSD